MTNAIYILRPDPNKQHLFAVTTNLDAAFSYFEARLDDLPDPDIDFFTWLIQGGYIEVRTPVENAF